MKTAFICLTALAMLTTPSLAAPISDVDHPDIPNCVMFPAGGVNPPNCETLSMIALFPPNGIQYSESCETVPYTNGQGQLKTKQVCHKVF